MRGPLVLLMTCLLSIGGAFGGVTGEANALEAALGIAWSGTTDPLYPLDNFRLGCARQPWTAAAVGTDEVLTVNMRCYDGGGFEGASLAADGWTPTGTAARSTLQARTGVASARLVAGDTAQRTREVKAGAKLWIEAFADAPLGGTVARVYISNPQRGTWWSDGGWSSSETPAMSGTAANDWTTWHDGAANGLQLVTMESAAVCGSTHTKLRITIKNQSGNPLYFDDVEVWPAVNALVIAGHNLPPQIDVETSFGLSLVPQAGAFYGYMPAAVITSPVVYVAFYGTPIDPISIGALWLCYMQEITPPEREHTMSVLYRQQEAHGTVLEQSTQEERTLPLSWTFGEGDGLSPREAYEAFRDAFLRPARGMAYPFALAWDTEGEPGSVMLARLEEHGYSVSREGTLWKVQATLVEMELPNLTS